MKTVTIGAIHPLHADTDGRLQSDRTRDSPHKGPEIAIVHRVVTSGKKSDRRQYGASIRCCFLREQTGFALAAGPLYIAEAPFEAVFVDTQYRMSGG